MKTAEEIYKENGFTDEMTLPKHLVITLMHKFADEKAKKAIELARYTVDLYHEEEILEKLKDL